MPKLAIAAVRTAGIALALLLASLGAGSCGGEDTELADPRRSGEVDPGEGASALNPRACAAVARGGKVDICHTSDLDAVPATALTVPVEACSTTHAEHADDFLADRDSGCKHEKPACKLPGKSCKIASGTPCCTGSCFCEKPNKCRCG
jgi:hypothetical protein